MNESPVNDRSYTHAWWVSPFFGNAAPDVPTGQITAFIVGITLSAPTIACGC